MDDDVGDDKVDEVEVPEVFELLEVDDFFVCEGWFQDSTSFGGVGFEKSVTELCSMMNE